MSFPFFKQPDAMDCGPTCLKMIGAYYKRDFSMELLRKRCYITREGVSFLGLSEAADSLGFRSIGVKVPLSRLEKEVPLPAILSWRQSHFVVLYKVKNGFFRVADPALGLLKYSREEFLKYWEGTKINDEPAGLVLIVEPTPSLSDSEEKMSGVKGFSFLLRYASLYRKYFVQLIAGLLLGSFIQLLLPFLTQAIIDVGINRNDLDFIYLILIAQLALIVSRMSVEFIRSWLLLHIGTRINISIISGFLQKLMALPVSFFDTKLTGDILQRIEDNNRIELFLTATSLSLLFSFFNLVVFTIVLAIYSPLIVLIFIVGALLYFLWIFAFMKPRVIIDDQRFKRMSVANTKLINIVHGIQEIRLTQSEQSQRWDWEAIQADLFKLKVKSLSLAQYQSAGATFINEATNILITIVAATSVLKGDLTLGMMLAIQFIIGQLNVPLIQSVSFLRMSQDARMSLDRLSEVNDMEEEEPDRDLKINEVPSGQNIYINNLSFQYEGPRSPWALKDIDLVFEHNKTTAIVGTSGSGKTTLIKLLLGIYKPVTGDIIIGNTSISNLNLKMWRKSTGAVMQDGYIFPGTIAYNIAPGISEPDIERIRFAASVSNVDEFVETLPLGYNTKIGANGHGLSQGQRQRILISRVIYKDPAIIILDEATNALDANNEKSITDKLQKFIEGKSVVVVAHRLSTVRNADKIVVLHKGRIIETGTHEQLVALKGSYFNLVKNQLELGT